MVEDTRCPRQGRSSSLIQIPALVSSQPVDIRRSLVILTGENIDRLGVQPADDAMAILTAMNSEEVEVIGLTTIFGNVYTGTATKNAFKLLEMAGRNQVAVSTYVVSQSYAVVHVLC